MLKNKKNLIKLMIRFQIKVGPLGLEPRLFGTKNQRVTSYTIGQYLVKRLQI